MTRTQKSRKAVVPNTTQAEDHGKDGDGRGRGRSRGRGRGRCSINHQTESSVNLIQKQKTTGDRGRGKKKQAIEHDALIQVLDSEAAKSGLTILDDEPAGSTVHDDALYGLSVSEQLERSQPKNEPFKLDYSAIIDNSNEIYEDSLETKTASISRSVKSTDKKRVLAVSSTKNKRHRITDLLEVSESEDGKDSSYESFKSSSSDDDDSKRQRSRKALASRDVKKDKPEALNEMKNVLEVCQWLIMERPDILAMANQMHNAKNALLDSPLINNMSAVSASKPVIVPPDNEKALARLWHEEIKCLFLRRRAPPDEAIEKLVTKIFNYELFSNNAEEVICHSKRVLTDFRSKLNKKIEARVHEFKEKRARERRTAVPTRLEIEEFMSQEVVEQILYRYLTGSDKNKLRKCGTMEKLILFVREAFKIHYNKYNIKAIKELDNITIDCKVPSRSGKNIALRLSLE